MTNKDKDLTIHFMPYSEIEKEDSTGRIKKILNIILQNKIVILQGRLKAEEESRLIGDTMVLIDHIKGFKGVELAVVSNDKNMGFFDKFKHGIARALVGQQDAVTIVGPANLVKEIKRNPQKIELFLKK
jgi:hypothetical protein